MQLKEYCKCWPNLETKNFDMMKAVLERTVVGVLLLLVLVLSGCGSDGNDSQGIQCPEGRHPLGSKCVCDTGIEVNGECVEPQDGDAEQMEESGLDDHESIDSLDGDVIEEDSEILDSMDDVLDEPEEIEEHYPVYEFPSARMLFDDSPVKEAKLASGGDVVLFAAYYNDSGNPHRYDLMSIRSRGGSAEFIGNVTWDPDVYSWLSFYVMPDDGKVLFSNNLNGIYILIMSSVETSTPQIIADACYPGHFAVSDDGLYIAYGKGMPEQNGGLLPVLYMMPTDFYSSERQIATQVIPQSFAFEPGTHNLVYGQGDTSKLFHVVRTNYDQSMNEVVAEDVGHPYFKLTQSPSGMVYYKKRGYQGLFLDLRFLDFVSRQEVSIEIINWESNSFMPNDIMLAMNEDMVVFAGPAEGMWKYLAANITGGRVYELVSNVGMRRAVLSSGAGEFLFVPMTYGDDHALIEVELGRQKTNLVCNFLLSDTMVSSSDGRYTFFTATLPSQYPQAGTRIVAAFDTRTGKSYVVANNPDGAVLLVSPDTRKLFYTNTNGSLVSVDLRFDEDCVLKIPEGDVDE